MQARHLPHVLCSSGMYRAQKAVTGHSFPALHGSACEGRSSPCWCGSHDAVGTWMVLVCCRSTTKQDLPLPRTL